MADSQQLGDMLTTINPANGQELERYPRMGDSDVETIIQNCHEAFLDWRHESPEKRGEIIKAIGEGLRSKKSELARLMTNEMGKLVKQGEQEVDLCAGICDWTAANGPKELAAEERELPNGGKGRIAYSPIGVIYGIQPWNFPAYQVIRYAIANLMAGNGVLLKHAESVTGSGLMLEKIFRDAGLPENLFSVLRINHDQSDAVIAHKLVRGVTLTGSAGAGQIIAKQAGEKLKKTVLELGSNDAYIVLADADLDKAVRQCVMGRVYNNGETCVAAKRFIVVDEIYDDFRDRFVKAMKDVKMGDPLNNEGDIGPMAREDLRDDLHEQVQKSVQNGAQIQCGGDVPKDDGWWYPATVLDNVKPGQPAYDDELFGPVASLIRAKDGDDAMRIANDSRFGLGGGIFSEDKEKAIELAEKHFDTGMVFINGFGLAQPNMPFGGVKDSGYGREHGGFGMKEFVNVKAINVMG
ncbi:NAD-dependent succinate-semialdehyde dehydrogenase [Henriciella sp.]|uniref:NAD-dependent succinate-semialdehyde dehydrogenase n=1 Tax=Henriciella sp. TaxID=1968823 RepID=UPI002605AE2D|nr:NAD-dependent succinate-semialdehyde dehydrogenase [Henriciella sp.]